MDKVTRADIHNLCLDNPVVYACLRLHQTGYTTFEESMMLAVKILVGQVDELEKELTDKILNSPIPSWKIE
jgi:hypothetical protein